LKKSLIQRGIYIGTDNAAINEYKFTRSTPLHDADTASS
jgi:hypothetical protein